MQQKPDISAILEARKFDHTKPIPADLIYFSILHDITPPAIIGTAGNFVSITGLPKAGKTTFISAMISSFIAQRPIFTFQLHTHENKNRICVFDTEQSPYDFQRTIKYIKRHTGLSDERIFQNLDCFLTRGDESITNLKMIHQYLKKNENTGIVIIDGILDLIDNMNDEIESKKLIRLLKKWSRDFNCLFITILHQGKKDLSSIGHIGSASDRYAQSTLVIEKSKEGTLLCKPKFLRSSADFDEIEIKFSNESKSYFQIKP